jgi:hypothetical protein
MIGVLVFYAACLGRNSFKEKHLETMCVPVPFRTCDSRFLHLHVNQFISIFIEIKKERYAGK